MAIADEEYDSASLQIRKQACDAGDGTPQRELVVAGRASLSSMEGWSVERSLNAFAHAVGVVGDAVEGTDQLAVDGEDGEMVVGVKILGDQFAERPREGGQ